MGENLLVGSHKHSTKAYTDGWERTFGNKSTKSTGERGPEEVGGEEKDENKCR